MLLLLQLLPISYHDDLAGMELYTGFPLLIGTAYSQTLSQSAASDPKLPVLMVTVTTGLLAVAVALSVNELLTIDRKGGAIVADAVMVTLFAVPPKFVLPDAALTVGALTTSEGGKGIAVK